jgi:hypothetical protein
MFSQRTALHRLLKHLELRMSFQLRNVITTSLLAWRTFIGQHTPAATAISNNQTSDSSSDEQQQQVQVEAVVRTPPSLCSPLFDVRMCVSRSSGDVAVQLEPGENGVTAACLGVLDEMVTTVKVSSTSCSCCALLRAAHSLVSMISTKLLQL